MEEIIKLQVKELKLRLLFLVLKSSETLFLSKFLIYLIVINLYDQLL